MKTTDVILRPVISEKANKLAEKMIYMFYVNSKATKVDVKKAVKDLYGHDVARVQMIVTPNKTKMLKKSLVDKRKAMKKAVVKMKGGKKLDVTKIAKEKASK